jgi:hypothetical protein
MSRRFIHPLLGSIALLLVAVSALAALSYTPWAPAANLESAPGTSSELNTPFLEGCPILSRNGRQLYIASDRPGGVGGLDIWVAERSSPHAPFGAPVNMGEPINSAYNDFCPSPQPGGRFMFVSDRPGGCGAGDIYLTRKSRANGWREPENLGCEVNSPAAEAGPVIWFGAGGPILYFSSTRPASALGANLYMSQWASGWSFAAPELVPGVNSDFDDAQPFIRHDGLELLFYSTRPDNSLGGADIWSASRESTHDDWSAPVNLGPNVNSASNETRPSLSWNGKVLLFGSNRPGVEGVSDIFYSTRDKVVEED